MVSGESREWRGNILRKVPVALWRVFCKCFVKSSLESNRRPRYFTVLDQGMVTFWSWGGFGFRVRRFVNNVSSVLATFTRSFHLLNYLSNWDMVELSLRVMVSGLHLSCYVLRQKMGRQKIPNWALVVIPWIWSIHNFFTNAFLSNYFF
jgi:hypothetical protein